MATNTTTLLLFCLAVVIAMASASKISTIETDEDQLIWDEDPSLELPAPLGKAVSTSCGGVLEGWSGEIAYKYGESFAAAEGCIWTVSVGNRSTIKVSILETFSREHAGHYFQVGFFNKSNYDQPNSFTWIRLAGHISPQVLEVPGPVAFIQFVSCSIYLGLGFRIGFEAGGEEETSIYKFENLFYNGISGKFSYPLNDKPYVNNQRTTIAINSPTLLNSFLFVQKLDVENSEGCLVDSVNVYQFTYASPQGSWDRSTVLCGSPVVGTTYPINMTGAVGHHDPIIITFKSDDSSVGKGFQVWWNQNN